MITKDEIIRLHIKEINQEGLGIGYHNNLPIIVANTLADEIIDVKIIDPSNKYVIGELLDIIEPSQHRAKAPCQYFSKCGGCSLQHLSNYQEYKLSTFKQELSEIGFAGKIHPTIQIAGNSRRRATFKISNNKLSFKQFHSIQTVAISNCLLLEDDINKLIMPINKLLSRLRLKVDMLSVMNSDTGIELLFHSNEKSNLSIDSMLAEFAIEHDIARIAWQIKSQPPFAIIQKKPVQLLFKNAYVDLPINSFLQVSKESTHLMSDIILKHLDKAKKILELYCGCGSFTIPISGKAHILAVEGSSAAIEALDKATRRSQLNIKAIKQDLYHNPLLPFVINDYSQVVINPPRNGATPQIKQIALSREVKKVILVSCSIANFIRDAKILIHAGFNAEEIYPIDQFLYSTHLEIIAIFKRK